MLTLRTSGLLTSYELVRLPGRNFNLDGIFLIKGKSNMNQIRHYDIAIEIAVRVDPF